MIKKISFSILISLSFIYSTFAQKSFSGTVISSNLKDPLSYVNIGVLNKDIGTVSNEKGKFELELKEEFLKDSLTFSIIGYRSLTIPIVDFEKEKTNDSEYRIFMVGGSAMYGVYATSDDTTIPGYLQQFYNLQ